VKASPVKVAKIRIIDAWDARVGTECGRCGSLLVTGGHRNAGCNFGAVCGKKSKQCHAQRIDGIRVHLSFANTSSGKLTIEISTAQRKELGNTLDIPR
jgi:hypothetical protein